MPSASFKASFLAAFNLGACPCGCSQVQQERAQFDIHLHDHIKPLKAKIRHKAILQYFSPFAAVELGTMAKAFNSDVLTIEKEVAALIMENQLDGKIDSHNKVRDAHLNLQHSQFRDGGGM